MQSRSGSSTVVSGRSTTGHVSVGRVPGCQQAGRAGPPDAGGAVPATTADPGPAEPVPVRHVLVPHGLPEVRARGQFHHEAQVLGLGPACRGDRVLRSVLSRLDHHHGRERPEDSRDSWAQPWRHSRPPSCAARLRAAASPVGAVDRSTGPAAARAAAGSVRRRGAAARSGPGPGRARPTRPSAQPVRSAPMAAVIRAARAQAGRRRARTPWPRRVRRGRRRTRRGAGPRPRCRGTGEQDRGHQHPQPDRGPHGGDSAVGPPPCRGSAGTGRRRGRADGCSGGSSAHHPGLDGGHGPAADPQRHTGTGRADTSATPWTPSPLAPSVRTTSAPSGRWRRRPPGPGRARRGRPAGPARGRHRCSAPRP